jgi:hypothetical protein
LSVPDEGYSEIGDLSTVKKLLKFKVNPNARDESGMSALTKACDGIKHVVFMFEIKIKSKH